ncbi:MAG: helix-turn-helix domain-containing protein [Thermoprotei archaeon]
MEFLTQILAFSTVAVLLAVLIGYDKAKRIPAHAYSTAGYIHEPVKPILTNGGASNTLDTGSVEQSKTITSTTSEVSNNIEEKEDKNTQANTTSEEQYVVETTKRRKTRTKLTESANKLILELYKQGYSVKQIAEQLGVSRSTVYRRLKKLLKAKTA